MSQQVLDALPSILNVPAIKAGKLRVVHEADRLVIEPSRKKVSVNRSADASPFGAFEPVNGNGNGNGNGATKKIAKPGNCKLPTRMFNRIIRLAQAGKTAAEIASETGVSFGTAQRWVEYATAQG
jgi:hypothetical protein